MALISQPKNPNVTIFIGNEIILRTGRIKRFTSPSTTAPTKMILKLRSMLKPSSKNDVATKAIAFETIALIILFIPNI